MSNKLIQRRDVLKGMIGRALKAIKEIPDTATEAAIAVKLNELEKNFALCHEAHMGVMELTGEEEIEFQEIEFDSIQTIFEQGRSILLEYLNEIQEAKEQRKQAAAIAVGHGAAAVQRREDVKLQIKLPAMQIPVFCGDYNSWKSFRDLFLDAIGNRRDVSGAQKLHYLKSYLQGEAAQLVRGYMVTDDNFDAAWTALENRYHNKRLLVNAQFSRLFNLPAVNSDSAAKLRLLIDTVNECVQALRSFDMPTDKWDAILVYFVTQRLDVDSHKQWEISLTDNEFPSFKDLINFLEKRCRSLEAIVSLNSSQSRGEKRIASHGKTAIHHASASSSSSSNTSMVCVLCKGNHVIENCKRFRALNVLDRRKMVSTHRLCFVCLKIGHVSADCDAPTCKTCAHKHHDTLHMTSGATRNSAKTVSTVTVTATADKTSDSAIKSIENSAVQANFGGEATTQILLSTAMVRINNSTEKIRVLLDQGSHACMIRESCVQRLKLQRKNVSVPIHGIGDTAAGTATSMVHIQIKSCSDDLAVFDVTALVMRKLTGLLPGKMVIRSNRPKFVNLLLADPTYYEPGEIDMIIGADVYGLLLRDGLIAGSSEPGKECPTAQNTSLGWILSGRISAKVSNASIPNVSSVINMHLDVERDLRKFWEIEEITDVDLSSEDEKLCEKHFIETHERDNTGRYVVRIPFIKSPKTHLGESRGAATRRLQLIEKRLMGQTDLRAQYQAFMDEYLELGHMKIASGKPIGNAYYLPHHFVIRESSTTTRLRVVFDASCKTSSGQSLNELQHVGSRLQDKLTELVMRFRRHAVALTADIAKMYRQIRVHEEDLNYQRILWRNDPADEITEYQLTTVTYGMAASPFMAIRALQQLARDEIRSHPLASRVVLSDFYVDDLITGCDNADDAKAMHLEMCSLMARGGFELRKWSSNSIETLECIPDALRESVVPLHMDEDKSVKTLGLQWFPAADYFAFKVIPPTCEDVVTKRVMLSVVARLFDPLGLLAPTIIVAKIMIQQLWTQGLTWDEELPKLLRDQWVKYHSSLPMLEQLKFPRWIGAYSGSKIELHGFADASEVAYGGVIYCKCISTDGTVSVSLLTAKTRVAPLQQVSIPRLELCAAVLVAKLLRSVMKSLDVDIQNVTMWSDSEVALCWIRKAPRSWKTFVANRVATIQAIAAPRLWRHVPTADNPADCLSRGVQPADLVDHPLWLHGPGWLKYDESQWPENKRDSETHAEERVTCNVTCMVPVVKSDENELLRRYSSLRRLLRITALVCRFAYNCRNSAAIRRRGKNVTVQETRDALLLWIRHVQATDFAKEIECCSKESRLLNQSKLRRLNPFLDDSNILRVGGRLRNAEITNDAAHPIVLSGTNALTSLIIADAHVQLLHGGAQMMSNYIRQRYWILNARGRIRQHVRNCVKCFRQKPRFELQQMGDLPRVRVTPSRAFLRSGVDYAGPVLYKSRAGRGFRTEKGYVALFVCLSTKAVHLEFVSELTSAAFIAAFRRFVARRGKCVELMSDNGTNFVGAKRELGQILRSHAHNEDVTRYLANDGTTWQMIPARSPHFGGLWEAGIKSVKHHLRRIIGEQLLTFEEYATLLAEIEAVLNSRPLCELSNDPSDLTALTPGHFLVGGPLVLVPEHNLDSTPRNRLSRWQLISQMTQQLWKRWRQEYLSTLQLRNKWLISTPNVQIGQLVLLKDECLPPTKWRLGRVTGTQPGKDGRVRVVSVKHVSGDMTCSISRICILPLT